MQATSIFIRRLARTVALALTVVALAAGPAAGAGVSDGKSSAAGQADKFIPGVTDFPSRLGESAERAAGARLARISEQGPAVNVQTEQSGFDWGAGATGAIAATLLLLGAALAVRTAKRGRVALG
jgi:hypothetical protein